MCSYPSFNDRNETISHSARKRISEMDHHPRWENIWRSVDVHLSTWDIGHKPSVMDLELAQYLEEVRSRFPPPKIRAKNP
ncbi:4a-hydroxytetrahydrobiopterin dehydratase [Bradyrhizobium guangdongense]